ncbi:MAG: hydrolase [Gemmatimonadetes bacterium]|nr:hydrolase [Gemmatimonadota bacterium]
MEPHDAPPPPPAAPSAAYAPRRATDDPDVFLIPDDQLPPGLAERVAAAAEPVPARAASTVVLVRDSAEGPQALLLRRHGRAGFAADAWVFPGGTVDGADRDPALSELMDGPPPSWWAARMALADEGEALGYVAAAIREAFEETGILLARGTSALGEGQATELRRALLAGEIQLADVARTAGVTLCAGDMCYVAHWITPAPEPRRYDTRFFLAAVTPEDVCVPHAAEMTDSAWLSPRAAVDRYRRGEMKLLPPTVKTLERICGFPSVAAIRDSLRDEPVPARLPVMERRPDGIAIVVRDQGMS